MSAETALPGRSARISDATQALIVRCAIRQMSHSQIASTAKVNRKTVARVLKRTRAALTINEATEQDRAEAVAVYREVQRTAWECIESAMNKGRSPAMLLAEVRLAQQRIDALLGLAPAGADDPVMLLAEFKSVVVRLIHDEAPHIAPVLARRLSEIPKNDIDR